MTWYKKFFTEEVSPLPLSLLRIGIAGTMLIQYLLMLSSLHEFYGEGGILQKELYDFIYEKNSLFPSIRLIANILAPYGITSTQCINGLYVFLCSSLFFLLLGYHTRLFAFLSWFTHFILMNSAISTLYGADSMHHIFLFYFMFFPINETLSIDSLMKSTSSSRLRTFGLRILQIHLCITYLDAGLSKTLGYMWWNGEAIWRSVMAEGYRHYDFSWLSHVPWLAAIIGYTTLVVEVFYPLFIWSKKTRSIWALLMISLHLGIAVFQGLWIFSFTMILLNVTLFLCDVDFSILFITNKINSRDNTNNRVGHHNWPGLN